MKEQILQILRSCPEKFLSVDEILKKATFLKGYEGKKVRKVLEKMIDEGSVVMTNRGKFAIGRSLGLLTGKIIGNNRGFAFFEPDGEGEDIFIAERNLNGACHGDTVQVKEFNFKSKKYSNKQSKSSRHEGEVVKVLKRGLEYVVGTIKFAPMGCVVVPDDKRFTDEIFIQKVEKIPLNTKVVVKILEYPSRTRMCCGEIFEVLGDASDLKVSTLSIIRSFNLFETFPENVINEAKKVAKVVSEKDLVGREDFRNELVFTIDGEDARDFDDAISLSTLDNGNFELKVHIADVSHYVKDGSALDGEAYKRGTSVYFPDMVLPMLPVELSNNICSLNENVERLTLSVVMEVNKKGDVERYRIVNGVIKSKNRMTYSKVAKILDGDKELCKEYAHLVPMLKEMKKLTNILLQKRERLGGIDFELPETQFVLNDKYEVLDVKEKPRTLADRLIEQFMILTNEVVAEFAVKNCLPFVYRVHESPTPEKLRAFNEFIKTIGVNYKLPINDIKPKEVQEFLNTLKGKSLETVINKVMLRSMQKAVYYEKCNGHFGLGSKYYCHFTSPIRRYPDLIIHRILKYFISGELDRKQKYFEEFVVDASEQSSDRERVADEAERTVDDLKKAEYMKKHIGEVYEGMCSGVNENGIFVVLKNTCEGFIPIEDLPKDNYYFEPERYRLVGKKHCFQLADTLKIKVVSSDLTLRRCNFAYIENSGSSEIGLQSSIMSDNKVKNDVKNAKKHC